MKILESYGYNYPELEEKLMSEVKYSTDLTIRMTKTTICEIDLHILKGDVPEIMESLIFSQDETGIYEEVVQDVSVINVASKTLISYKFLGKMRSFKM